MGKLNKEQEIINILFKDFLADYNSRNMSKVVGLSHAGTFKILKKLEKESLIKGRRIGKAVVYSLNYDNSVTSKIIEMILTIESQDYGRWLEEFSELKDKAEFIVLFGSIIKEENKARDVDVLVAADKKHHKYIKYFIVKRNKLSNKKIHLILQTMQEFTEDLKNKNKAVIEIIKSGIVLYGQDKFVKMIR